MSGIAERALAMLVQETMPHRSRPPILIAASQADDVLAVSRNLMAGGLPNPIRAFTSADAALAHLQLVAASTESKVPTALVYDRDLGFDAILQQMTWVRGQSRLKQIPIALQAAAYAPGECERAAAAGATTCLVKPVAPADWQSALQRPTP